MISILFAVYLCVCMYVMCTRWNFIVFSVVWITNSIDFLSRAFCSILEFHHNSSSSDFKNTLFQYLIWLAFVTAISLLLHPLQTIVIVTAASRWNLIARVKQKEEKKTRKREQNFNLHPVYNSFIVLQLKYIRGWMCGNFWINECQIKKEDNDRNREEIKQYYLWMLYPFIYPSDGKRVSA